eukprot:NODE_26_length_40862_cov_0.679513.p1 type:complete len:1182 gc:universal NODE_26_length_40862_cov_0.679513:7463-11008(+)
MDQLRDDFLQCKRLCLPQKYEYIPNQFNGALNLNSIIDQINCVLSKRPENILCKEIKEWAFANLDEMPTKLLVWFENDKHYLQRIVNDHISSHNRILLMVRNFCFFNEFKSSPKYFDIIRYGLTEEDTKTKKMSLHLLQLVLNVIKSDSIEFEKFVHLPSMAEDWQLYLLIAQATLEQQLHVWKHVEPRILYLWKKYEEKPAFIKWIIALLHRGLKNGSNSVRKSVAMFILTSEIGNSLHRLDHRFLFNQFFVYLDETYIFTSQGTFHLYSDFGHNLSIYVKNLILSSKNPYLMFKELLEYSEHINSHVALYFYLSGILMTVKNSSDLQNDSVITKVLKLFKSHFFSSRLVLVRVLVVELIDLMEKLSYSLSKDIGMSLVSLISQYGITKKFEIWKLNINMVKDLTVSCLKDIQYHFSFQTFKNLNVLFEILADNAIEFNSYLVNSLQVIECQIDDKSNVHASIYLGLIKANKLVHDYFHTFALKDANIRRYFNEIYKMGLSHNDMIMELGDLLIFYSHLIDLPDEKLTNESNLIHSLVAMLVNSNSAKEIFDYDILSAQKEMRPWIFRFKMKVASLKYTQDDEFQASDILDLIDNQSSTSVGSFFDFLEKVLQFKLNFEPLPVLSNLCSKTFELISHSKKYKVVRRLVSLIYRSDLEIDNVKALHDIIIAHCNEIPYVSEIIVKELSKIQNVDFFLADFSTFGPERDFGTIYSEELISKTAKISSLLKSDHATRLLAINSIKDRELAVNWLIEKLTSEELYPLVEYSSHISFKIKIRCYCAILMMTNVTHLENQFENLLFLARKERNPNVKTFTEWLLCIVCQDPKYLNQMILNLGYTENINSTISIMIVLIRLQNFGKLSPSEIIDRFLLFYCSSCHYATRVHVQYLIKMIDSSNEALSIIKKSFNAGVEKSFDKCIHSNYMVGHLDIKKDINFEMLFNLIPLYLKFDFTEIMSTSSFSFTTDLSVLAESRSIAKFMQLDEDEEEAIEAWKQDSLFMQRKYVNDFFDFDFSKTSKQIQLKYKKRKPVIIVGTLIDNPGNLAALCRTCEVFLFDKLIVHNTAVKKDPKFLSVSVSSENWIPIEAVEKNNLPSYLEDMKTKGYSLVALEQSQNSIELGQFDIPEKCIILMGNERTGIPSHLLQLVDYCVEVPQFGVTKSLNVNVATSMLLFEYVRQHKQSE